MIAGLSLPIARDLDAFRRHPLVRWLEYKLGVEFERGGGLRRRMPRSLPEVVPRLAEFATAEQSHCEERLREVLTLGGELVREDGNRALAFKLHQFISQGRALYATLEATGAREFSLEGQLQAGSGRLCLEELASNDTHWGFHSSVAALPAERREVLVRAVLDRFRHKLAISSKVLEETFQQQLRRRSEQHLNDFWGLDPEANELRQAQRFVRLGRSPRFAEGFSLGERSALGRLLRARLRLDGSEYWRFLDNLLDLLVRQGLLVRLDPIDDHQFYQLDAACIVWRKGDGSPPPPSPIYTRRAYGEGYEKVPPRVNAFFQRFYQASARSVAQLEAREHTAQVVEPGERERRERRFRWEESDRRKAAELGRPAVPCLLADHGTRSRYCGPRPSPPAKCAAHTGKVRPAERPGRTAGTAWSDRHYCGAINSHP